LAPLGDSSLRSRVTEGRHMHTVSVMNYKGGVGKTTVVANLEPGGRTCLPGPQSASR